MWRNHSKNYVIIKGILKGSKGIFKKKKGQAPSPWSLGASCACRNFCTIVFGEEAIGFGGQSLSHNCFFLENQHPQHLGQEENREFYCSKLTIAFKFFENLHVLGHHCKDLGSFNIPRSFLIQFLSFWDS